MNDAAIRRNSPYASETRDSKAFSSPKFALTRSVDTCSDCIIQSFSGLPEQVVAGGLSDLTSGSEPFWPSDTEVGQLWGCVSLAGVCARKTTRTCSVAAVIPGLRGRVDHPFCAVDD